MPAETIFNNDPKDFVCTFESRGTTFLFEDLVSKYYWFGNAITINDGKSLKAFILNSKLEELRKDGLKRSVGETKTAIAALIELVNKTLADTDLYQEKVSLTLDDVKHMFSVLGAISEQYQYFDPYSWDDVFIQAENDPDAKENVQLVQSFKNEIRGQMDPIYFAKNGYMQTLIHKIGEQFEIPEEKLNWYTEEEILGLFADESAQPVPDTTITERQKGFLLYQPDTGRDISGLGRILLAGEDALKVNNIFLIAHDLGISETNDRIKSFKGRVAHGKGQIVRGKVKKINRQYGSYVDTQRAMDEMQKGDILVSDTTDPELMPALRKASAIVTDIGGMLSHAAITARELDIPCIVETKNASKVLRDGDEIEVDTEKGVVTVIK